MPGTARNLIARVLASSLGVLLIALAVVPAFSTGLLSEWVMAGFSTVCHQLPGRSPHVDGHQLAACHRCFGIYAGIILGALIMPLGRDILADWRAYVVPGIAMAVAPAGLDWLGGMLGFWTTGPVVRAITGAVFGMVGGAFILIAIRDLMQRPHSVDV
jgi:uncharacterized membrane protein